MAEYIEREEIMNRLFTEYATDSKADVFELIRSIPVADVQPVKRGHWEKDEKGQFHHCSECEAETFRDVDSWGLDYGEYLSDFCPCCGADMRGDDNG